MYISLDLCLRAISIIPINRTFLFLVVALLKMFYKVTLEKLLTVAPDKLDYNLNRHLLNFLCEAVVGQSMPTPASTSAALQREYRSASKSSAVILAVLDILGAQDIKGKVLDNGSISFLLRYDALVLKMHRGEVVDAHVEKVSLDGWWGSVFGVGNVFVSQSQMSGDPSTLPQWAFESSVAGGMWISKDGTKSIRVGDFVRIRVLGETPQSSSTMVVGTMAGPYLGPL